MLLVRNAPPGKKLNRGGYDLPTGEYWAGADGTCIECLQRQPQAGVGQIGQVPCQWNNIVRLLCVGERMQSSFIDILNYGHVLTKLPPEATQPDGKWTGTPLAHRESNDC